MKITREDAKQKALEEIYAKISKEGGFAINRTSPDGRYKWNNIEVWLAILGDKNLNGEFFEIPNTNPIDEMYNRLLQEQEKRIL